MAKGMKREELQKCLLCGKGMLSGGHILFTRVTLERFVPNLPGIQRQHGLEMMLGSPALAHAMGPDEDIALPVGEPLSALLCLECSCRPEAVYSILERMEERESIRTSAPVAPEEEASN